MADFNLSIVVVFYDMEREAPRTLLTLGKGYQGITSERVELIAVDNGSPEPLRLDLPPSDFDSVKLVRIDDASPSPCQALNAGVAGASADRIMLMIDGARMLTPGVVRGGLDALDMIPDSIATPASFHLGRGTREPALDRAAEDELLASVDWRSSGYDLFRIGASAGSTKVPWVGPMSESTCVIMPKDHFTRIGGFNESFRSPGGGYANIEFFERAARASRVVALMGEATFHQTHGGAATGLPPEQRKPILEAWKRDYVAITGHTGGPRFRAPDMTYGRIQPAAWKAFNDAVGRWHSKLTDRRNRRNTKP